MMRFNLFGGPGTGKSTVAADVFSRLKKRQVNIELVTEWVKQWTYINRIPQSFDQLLIFGNQIAKEDLVFRGGFDYLISDSPSWLACYYANLYKCPIVEEMINICNKFEEKYPSVNIFIEREDRFFSEVARFQDYEASKNIDKEMKNFFKHYLDLEFFSVNDTDGIFAYIESKVKYD